MESHCIFLNQVNQNFLVRNRRIRKFDKKGESWKQNNLFLRNSRSVSEKEHETCSQSLNNNVSQNFEDRENCHCSKIKPDTQTLNVSLLSQEVLQQELIKMFKKYDRLADNNRTDAKNQREVVGFNSIKSGSPAPTDVEEPKCEKRTFGHIKLKISKPRDYEYCYIGPRREERLLSKTEEKKSESETTEMTSFETLKMLLLNLFTNQVKDVDLKKLGTYETSVFKAVLERKNYSSSYITNVISHISQKSTINASVRRSEEKFKFVIKRIIKHLKKKEKIKSEHEFYQIYFSELSNKLAIPLNYFYDPHNKLLKNTRFKSLSTDYVMLLLKSDIFLIELLFYLEHAIIKDHIDSLDTKVGNLCKKWESIYESLQKSNKSAEFIQELILNTEKGSKLPWSVGEVKEAIDLMKNIIYSWNSQKYSR